MNHQQISIPSPTHKETHTLPPPSSAPLKLANPAVVGLAGFALTTFVLQLHNLEVCGIGPVIALGLVFGGGCQLLAGLMEMCTGNGFGFAAFTGLFEE
jgi:succinate-acetate transporter protein